MKVLKRFKHPDGHEIQLRDHGIGTKPRYSVADVWKRKTDLNTQSWVWSNHTYLGDAERAFEKKVAEAHGEQHE